MKIAVALSGGADSAICALLAKKRSHKVTAYHMLIDDQDCMPERIQQVKNLAKAIELPLEIIDLREEFESTVISPFVEGYACGFTPNPCVFCNRKIKFGILFSKALSDGFDLFSTGHYARIDSKSGRYRLLRGKDKQKDQSYVLWSLSEEELSRLFLPLGLLTKTEVQALIRNAGLEMLVRPESQDICFLNGENYISLVKERHPEACEEGPILDLKGNIIGKHKGIAHYTIGQRKGIGLSNLGAQYVLKIDFEKNAITIGERCDYDSIGFEVDNINFIQGSPPHSRFSCQVATRYQGKLTSAVVEVKNSSRAIVFCKHWPAAAPGQSAVFYKGDEVLGGGVITQSIPDKNKY